MLGVYNAEQYIAEQLESILTQTCQDWILYIRDDASTDNTLQIMNEFASKYADKIKIVTDNLGNLGCNGNYFHLLQLVNAKYYMFCNADDFWFPFKVEISYKRMLEIEKEQGNKPIIVHTDLTITDERLNILAESYWEKNNVNPEKYKTYNKIGICSMVAGATMIFNQKVKDLTFPVLEGAPFFDHWMALQTVKTGVISTIHAPTIAYRQIGSNLAAVSIGSDNTLLNKIKNVKKVLNYNKKEVEMLRKIGWGSYSKYFLFKLIVFSQLRFGKKYTSKGKDEANIHLKKINK